MSYSELAGADFGDQLRKMSGMSSSENRQKAAKALQKRMRGAARRGEHLCVFSAYELPEFGFDESCTSEADPHFIKLIQSWNVSVTFKKSKCPSSICEKCIDGLDCSRAHGYDYHVSW